MDQWNSFHDILDFVIGNEEAAAAFYTDLAAKMDSPGISSLFEEFAREEEGHKAKLQRMKQSGQAEPLSGEITDLKIGDYLVDAAPNADLNYQQALILAMQQEKAAFKLYTDLAAKAPEGDVRTTLLALAQEEAKHKLRFEVEYDDEILKEN